MVVVVVVLLLLLLLLLAVGWRWSLLQRGRCSADAELQQRCVGTRHARWCQLVSKSTQRLFPVLVGLCWVGTGGKKGADEDMDMLRPVAGSGLACSR